MGKYATGRKPDMTNNFFLMQDLDIVLFHEISELVWAACYDDALHVRVMKRITEAAFAFQDVTSFYDGQNGSAVKYNWMPVRFYMALTRGGKVDEYDGFKITVVCEDVGLTKGVEIFFSKQAFDSYQYGVYGRAELGGWASRVPATPVPDRPVASEPKTMELYTVWNAMRSEGFVTTDKQLAYETRKCATTNLFDEFGNHSPVAAAFCEKWGDDDLTTEVRVVSATLEGMTAQGLADLFQYYATGHVGGFIHVQNKLDQHPTIHALMLLNEIAPMIGERGREPMPLDPATKNFLNHDYEAFMKNATREHVLELVRCGVRFAADVELFDLQGGNK